MVNLAALRAAVFFAICEKPEGGGRITAPPPGRARVKPGKDQQCVESYRPISLTNCACKIIERLVNTRLRYYLEANNLLDPFQSGFRGQHSTADNIARLISDVQIYKLGASEPYCRRLS